MIIKDNIEEIKQLYINGMHSLAMIADKFKCTRQYIKKVLNANGIQTAKGIYTRVKCECAMCGKEFFKNRSRKRNLVSYNDYCSKKCYHDFLYFENSVDDNSGRTAARIKMSIEILQTIKLPKGAVVHHIDRNTRNNNPANLILFVDQAAHLRHHRNCPIPPSAILYNGALDSPTYRSQCAARIKQMLGIG